MSSEAKIRNRRPARPKGPMTTNLDQTAQLIADRLEAAMATQDAKWEEIEALRLALAAAGYRKVKRWNAWFPLSPDASRTALRKLRKTHTFLTAHEMMSLERSLQRREAAIAATSASPATLTAIFNDTPRGREERDLFLARLPKGAHEQEDGTRLLRTPEGYVRIVIGLEADPNPQHLSYSSFAGDAARELFFRLGRKASGPARRGRRRR